MRSKNVLLMLFLCLMVISIGSISVNAQINYEFGAQKLLPSTYLAPRLDCRDYTGMDCVLVAYNDVAKRVEVFTTRSRFSQESYPLTPNQTFPVNTGISTLISKYPSAAVPYDVIYLQSDSETLATGGFDWKIGGSSAQRDFGFIIAYNDSIYGIDVDDGEFNTVDINTSLSNGTWRWFIDNSNLLLTFIGINPDIGAITTYHWNGASGNVNYLLKDWSSVDYLGGKIMDTEFSINQTNQSYLLVGWNSGSGIVVRSNTTDEMIGIGNYTGFYELVSRLSSYRYFAKNSTDVIQYDDDADSILSFWKMNGNDIVSQSMFQRLYEVDDKAIVFQNSTGTYLYNAWSSLYVALPEEYNDTLTVQALPTDYFLGLFNANNPYYPRVACTPDFGSCAMLVYDSGIVSWGGAGLKLYYTTTPNNPDWARTFVFSESYSTEITNLPEFSFPYDIRYNTADGKFRIISKSNLYEWDGSGNPTLVYAYNTTSCTGITSYKTCGHGLEFADEEGDTNFAMFSYGYITNVVRLCLVPWKANIFSAIDTITLDSGAGQWVDIMQGHGYSNDTDILLYDVHTQRSTNPFNPSLHEHFSNLGTSDDFNYTGGVQYYYPEEGMAFMERGSSDQPANVGEGMYYAGQLHPDGFDWIYPSVSPYYIYDAVYAEQTDAESRYFEGYKIYGVAKRRLDYGCIPFFGCGKVFFYKKANNPVFVTTSYYDEEIETTNPLITNMQLNCIDPLINYTVSAGDSFHAFQLPCNSNINLTLQTTAAYPFYYEMNFDFFGGCSEMSIETVYIRSFTSTLTVRDQVTGNAIPSATVYIDGSPYTTDADGQIDFIIAPTGADFALTNYPSSCLITLDSTGAVISENRYIYATKAGYYPFTGTIAFTPEGQTIYLNQGEFIISRVYYKDGIEATGEKTSAMINATGADQIYVIRNGIPYNESEDNDFPVTLQTIDAASSYSVTLGLTWGNYTDTTVVSITPAKNNYGCNENACFELPFYSTDAEVGCATDLDCEQSYCLGTIFKELIQCNVGTGQCMYQQTACPTFCDDDIGCYTQVEINESCNFDTECYDLIGCITSAVLRDAHCSPSLGVCVTEHVQCSYGCVDDACVAPPAPYYCDQSTVVGMLGCLQSGIMGFIGYTYDPLFIILIVVAIVIIFATLLGLAVKGVSNVIR